MTWLAVASAVVSAVGALRQGGAAAQESDYNAAVAKQQGELARQQADYEAQRLADRRTKVLASQRAAYASSGIDPNAGSPLEVASETAAQAELDILRTRWQGEVGQTQAKQQASQLQTQGSAARTAGYFSAGSSLLGGASRAYALSQSSGE